MTLVNTIRRNQKAKIFQKLKNIERVLNFIIFIDKKNVRFNPLRDN